MSWVFLKSSKKTGALEHPFFVFYTSTGHKQHAGPTGLYITSAEESG